MPGLPSFTNPTGVILLWTSFQIAAYIQTRAVILLGSERLSPFLTRGLYTHTQC